jgi:anti-sigma B factor antagonist
LEGRVENLEKFKLFIKTGDNVDRIYLKGELDAHTAPELENAISNLLLKGRTNFLINFKELDYISSAGLGVFMAFIEEIRQKGGDIKMAEMRPKVFSIFDLLGFPILFDIEKEENDALIKFTK